MFAGAASAKVIELGVPKTALISPPPCTSTTSGAKAVPKCPYGLSAAHYGILQTRVTALATLADGTAYPTMAPHAGRIVAFTVGLSALDTYRPERKYEIESADINFGGTTRVGLTVLRRVGSKKDLTWKVAAQSPAVHIEPYLGDVVQFPLNNTLPVAHGDVVALTTTTWAPVLTLQQDSKKFAYSQSRKAGCPNPPRLSQAQTSIGEKTKYACAYPGTRVEYSVTEVTSTGYPKHYVHSPDIVGKAASDSAPSASPLVITGGSGL